MFHVGAPAGALARQRCPVSERRRQVRTEAAPPRPRKAKAAPVPAGPVAEAEEPRGVQPKTARGEATRRAILDAAERVIGAKGFSEASIGAITREAGCAQGTFYIYFKSKEEVFSELVLEMGRLVRRALTQATANIPDRLDAEKAGLRGFLDFVAAHPDLYRIIQEALFVDPAAYRAYFSSFAEGYRLALADAEAAGQIRPGDCDVRAWALMGIARALGERAVIWEDRTPVAEVVDAAHDLIVHGLQPRGDKP
ncbi:TetR family transcriptional regulator [Microvirga tunisiensis]|uniref:TetR family transcriptional regulator n=1 Tax=Pannonibacter tanglangensis TaxID=2750084 RepID=A0ABW9ZI84_9HYPH|nr:TetR family transcriptional regulator [Pannonibacter sp. XCT-34]